RRPLVPGHRLLIVLLDTEAAAVEMADIAHGGRIVLAGKDDPFVIGFLVVFRFIGRDAGRKARLCHRRRNKRQQKREGQRRHGYSVSFHRLRPASARCLNARAIVSRQDMICHEPSGWRQAVPYPFSSLPSISTVCWNSRQ